MNIKSSFTFLPSKKKPVYNWFYYKEAFSPEIVDYSISFISNLGININTIYDPFAGVGTTLLRAKELGLSSYGVDVSLLAVLASKVKTRNYSIQDKEQALSILKDFDYNYGSVDWHFELFSPDKAFPKRNLNELLALRSQIESIENEKLYEFFLLALVSVIPQVSYVIKDGGVLRINKNKPCARTKYIFKRKAKRMIKEMMLIKGKEPIIKQASALEEQIKADAVITSPPYLNNVDYTKVYGLELSFIALERGIEKKIRGKALRSFFSYKVKDFNNAKLPIVKHYFDDLRRLFNVLNKNVKAIAFIVSDAFLNEYIPVVEITKKIAQSEGFEFISELIGPRRKAMPGVLLKESLLFFNNNML